MYTHWCFIKGEGDYASKQRVPIYNFTDLPCVYYTKKNNKDLHNILRILNENTKIIPTKNYKKYIFMQI